MCPTVPVCMHCLDVGLWWMICYSICEMKCYCIYVNINGMILVCIDVVGFTILQWVIDVAIDFCWWMSLLVKTLLQESVKENSVNYYEIGENY